MNVSEVRLSVIKNNSATLNGGGVFLSNSIDALFMDNILFGIDIKIFTIDSSNMISQRMKHLEKIVVCMCLE